jgi:hypothetical protein
VAAADVPKCTVRHMGGSITRLSASVQPRQAQKSPAKFASAPSTFQARAYFSRKLKTYGRNAPLVPTLSGT